MKVFNEVGTVFVDSRPSKRWDALVYFDVYYRDWENVNSPEFPETIKSEIWYEDKTGNFKKIFNDWGKYILIRRTYPSRTQAYKAAKKIADGMTKNYVLSFISITRVAD